MGATRGLILSSCCLFWPTVDMAAPHTPPPLMLASVYRTDAAVNLAEYWISEKYDGVRAYWDGEKLLSRSGARIAAPAWFVAGWPRQALDGELWAGRGRFEATLAAVRDATPQDTAWRSVRFMVFDLPQHPGDFSARLLAAKKLLSTPRLASLHVAPQFKLADRQALDAALREVTVGGGEGLMLHRASALHQVARSDDLLKLKLYQDGEAQVIGYLPGQGKYRGLLGALQVRTAAGARFRLGSGFSDAQRRQPPPIGSWVTYRYNGLTAKGLPRFARFSRVRDAELAGGAPDAQP